MYEKEGVSFLLDETDTVQAYEAQDTSVAETQYERGMKALSSLSRVQQVEAIEGVSFRGCILLKQKDENVHYMYIFNPFLKFCLNNFYGS